ncbi:hypothetical protein HETIRDRAFT_324730 [Heterobasidion irregulare TC 32-1]|uniref:Chitin-binding type-4 domain-containing protein n=1 Tax=Heterobasidion irregulare (strain TC 32-1) TaxID=747525 RepID=W4JYN3_HETIT|nr:uncharacterized protein HETIRDRAFT_324730 [Heterobasidion irregulare TC 32-1]ETW78677.1 hypothetical protein HETIRDRAFT_324730 [Heterobasidion irregulare TC 32-1]
MDFFVKSIILAGFIGQALAHGVVTSPSPRKIGSAAKSACGTAVYSALASDKYGPIENAAKKIDDTYNAEACHLFFCKGYQYEDNAANTRVYTAGQVVNMQVDLAAHHTGHANVSVVNLSSQTTIGKPLYLWPVYANSSLGPSKWPTNETNFNVTIPDLGDECTTAGACAIQWWWYADSNGQTYESCVDFTTE